MNGLCIYLYHIESDLIIPTILARVYSVQGTTQPIMYRQVVMISTSGCLAAAGLAAGLNLQTRQAWLVEHAGRDETTITSVIVTGSNLCCLQIRDV